jgi:general secretion pathway protein C
VGTEFKNLSLSQWQFFVRLLLLIWLSLNLARFFWLIMPSPFVATVNVSNLSHGVEINKTQTNTVDLDQLKSLAIFGKAQSVAKNVSVNVNAAQTNLNLSLMGVITSNLESMSRAIISVGQKPELYAVGARLPVGEAISVVKVMKDRVIISNNGQFESLFLYQNDPKNTFSSAINTTSLSREQEQKMAEWQAEHAEPEAPPPREKPVIFSNEQAVAEVETSLSEVVVMSAYQESGTMTGYKISPGRNQEKFRELGLKSGDVVVAINGWPMSDPQKIAEMYQDMGSSHSASVQIKRGNQVMLVDLAVQ